MDGCQSAISWLTEVICLYQTNDGPNSRPGFGPTLRAGVSETHLDVAALDVQDERLMLEVRHAGRRRRACERC